MEERNINKGIHDIERSFDMEGVWENINQEKSKNRGGFWLFLSIPLLLLMGLGFYSIYPNQQEGNVQDNNLTSSPILASKSTTSNQNKRSLNNEIANAQRPSANAANSLENNTPPAKIYNKNGSEENTEISDNSSQVEASSITENYSFNEKTNTSIAETPRSGSRAIDKTIQTPLHTLRIGSSKSNNSNSYSAIEKSEKTKEESREAVVILQTIGGLNHGVTSLYNDHNLALGLTPSPISVITIDKRPHSWQIEVLGGFGIPMRGLSNKGSSRESIISNREASEQVLEYIQATLGIRKFWTSTFSTGVGLGIAQLSESFISAESHIQNIEDIDSEDLPEGVEGKSGYIIRNQKATYYNTFRSLDLNLDIAYIIPIDHLKLQAYGGLAYNLNLQKDVHYFDSFLNIQKADNLFKERMPIQWYIGTDIVFPLSSFTFFTGIQYRRVSDISNHSNPIGQRYHVIGGRAGFGLLF